MQHLAEQSEADLERLEAFGALLVAPKEVDRGPEALEERVLSILSVGIILRSPFCSVSSIGPNNVFDVS